VNKIKANLRDKAPTDHRHGTLHVPEGTRFTYRKDRRRGLISVDAVHTQSGLRVRALSTDVDHAHEHALTMLREGVAKLGVVVAGER
jgi:hypothetical protein